MLNQRDDSPNWWNYFQKRVVTVSLCYSTIVIDWFIICIYDSVFSVFVLPRFYPRANKIKIRIRQYYCYDFWKLIWIHLKPLPSNILFLDSNKVRFNLTLTPLQCAALRNTVKAAGVEQASAQLVYGTIVLRLPGEYTFIPLNLSHNRLSW